MVSRGTARACGIAAHGGAWDDIGCNWRRARAGDQSMDGLSVKNPADGRCYFEDVIANAGTSGASIKYRHPFRDGALLREVAGGPYAPTNGRACERPGGGSFVGDVYT